MRIPNENDRDYTPTPEDVPDDDGDEAAREVARVPNEAAGERLDRVLARLLPHHSRSRLKAWIEAGRLAVEGRRETTPGSRMKGGEILILSALPEPEACAQKPEAIALNVVYEDASLLVINKPAGLVTHPGSGNWSGTLMNALLYRDPALAEIPRAGIVHRLDKDTSGLLVVARTLMAQTDLVRQLQAKSVRRKYLAVARGEIPRDGYVDAPIGRHPRERIKMAVIPQGKPAVTRYRVLKRYRGACLVACSLETGRTHQIRVHLAHLGYPLLGDPVYGRGRAAAHLPDFPRQALHAFRLGVIHPESGEALTWEAPLPEDLQALLEKLEATRHG